MSFSKIDIVKDINRFNRTIKNGSGSFSYSVGNGTIEASPIMDYSGRFRCTNYYKKKCRPADPYLPGYLEAVGLLSLPDTTETLQALMVYENPLFDIREDGKSLIDHSTTGDVRPVQPGRYLTFDGTNDVAYNLSVQPSVVGGFTVALWANLTIPASVRSCLFGSRISSSDNFSIGYGLSGVLGLYVTDPLLGVVRAARLSSDLAGEWHHIAFTYDPSIPEMKLYLDGIETSMPTIDSGAIPTTAGTFLGASSTSGASPTIGSLKGAGLWTGLLTPTEIAALANPATAHVIPQIANCVDFWHCEDNDQYFICGCVNSTQMTLTGITVPTFLAEGGDSPYSAANAVGFTGNRNLLLYSEDVTQWTDSTAAAADPTHIVLASNGLVQRKYQYLGGSLSHTGRTWTSRVVLTSDQDCDAFIYAYGSTGMQFLHPNGIYTHLTAGVPTVLERTNTAAGDSSYSSGRILWGIGATNCAAFPTTIAISEAQLEENDEATPYQPRSALRADTGTIVSRDESSPTLDVLGGSLENTGRVPYDGLLLGAPCVTLDSSNDYIELPSTLNGTTLYSFSCKFYASTAIDSATSYVDGGVAKWNVTGGYSHITLGSWTSLITGEVISIGESLGTNRRTSVVDITISQGWHDLEIRWNSSESRYDIILDGVTQVVTSDAQSHIPLQTILSDAKIGIGHDTGSYSPFSFADIKFRSDADTITCDVPCSDQYSDYLTNRADPDNPAQLVGHTLASTWSNTQDEFFGSIVNGCDVVPWFNGASSKIDVATASWNDNATYTIAAKFRVDDLSANRTIVGNATNIGNLIAITTAGALRVYIGGTTGGTNMVNSANGVITVGKWYSMSVSFDGTTVVATLDGVEVINQAPTTPALLPGLFVIGQKDAGGYPFIGSICDVSISNACTYDCDEGSTTVTDTSGNGNNGTGSNLTWLAIPTQTDGGSTVGRTAPTSAGGTLPLGVQTGILRSGGIDSPMATQQGWNISTPWEGGDGAEISPNVHIGETDGPFKQFYSFKT